jgi:hypothetical protein
LSKCPSDCNGRICIRPKKASSKSKLAYSTCPRFPNPSGVDQSVMCSTGVDGLNLDKCRIGYLNDCPRTHRCCVYKCGGVCVHL